MKKETKIVVLVGAIFLLVLGCWAYLFIPPVSPPPCKHPTFTKSSDNKSIYVTQLGYEIKDELLIWENVRIINGSLELPSAKIELGQRINNCSGRITLEWIPCNEIFFDEEFG